jgi:hypothetical protein
MLFVIGPNLSVSSFAGLVVTFKNYLAALFSIPNRMWEPEEALPSARDSGSVAAMSPTDARLGRQRELPPQLPREPVLCRAIHLAMFRALAFPAHSRHSPQACHHHRPARPAPPQTPIPTTDRTSVEKLDRNRPG